MKRGSTLFLKIIVSLFMLGVLALCVFVLPRGITNAHAGGYRIILIGMYIPAIPFFIGGHQTLKMLTLIDKNKAFSVSTIKSLQYIKYCAAIVGTLYAVALPYIYSLAKEDDAPGVMLLGLIFTFAPLIITVFTALLQKVLGNALNLKSENDLTI